MRRLGAWTVNAWCHIGAIVYTNMLSHDLAHNLKAQAKVRDIPIFGPLSSGAAKRLIAPALPEVAKKNLVANLRERMDQSEQADPETAVVVTTPALRHSHLVELIDNVVVELSLIREHVITLEQKLDTAQTQRQASEADLAALATLKQLLGAKP